MAFLCFFVLSISTHNKILLMETCLSGWRMNPAFYPSHPTPSYLRNSALIYLYKSKTNDYMVAIHLQCVMRNAAQFTSNLAQFWGAHCHGFKLSIKETILDGQKIYLRKRGKLFKNFILISLYKRCKTYFFI